MDDPSDQSPSERRDDAAGETVVTPRALVEQFVGAQDERRRQLDIVDEFVVSYFGTIRDIGAELAAAVPARIPVEASYSCTADRSRCIQRLRFDSIRFSFVHLREVAFFSTAPVPEEIAGQVILYVQEVPPIQGIPYADAHLISALLVYPLRREWRLLWGTSPGRLHPFTETDALREKALREIRGVLTGASGYRRWPELESIARLPAAVLEIDEDRAQAASIGFLRPSLKGQRVLMPEEAAGKARATGDAGTHAPPQPIPAAPAPPPAPAPRRPAR